MRRVVWLLVIAALIAACGGDEGTGTTTPAPAGEAAPTTMPAPTSTSPEAVTTTGVDTAVTTTQATSTTIPDTADVPEGRAVVTENPDGTRTVTWQGGSTVVPADPQRIVTVIGDIDLESLIALGITPVGSGTQDGTIEGGFAPHLTDLTADVERLSWTDDIPYEAIAALDPDLIFSYGEFGRLGRIAPTVPSGAWIGNEWRDDFRYIAAVVGADEQADSVLADFDARAAEVAGEIAPAVDGRTVATAQVARDHTQMLVDPADSFALSVLGDLGLDPAPVIAGTSGGEHIPLSFEQLDQIDAGILFWQVRQGEDGAPDEAGVAVATASPLWGTLPAVQDDAVYYVDNRPWYFPTILSARQIVDDVEAALAQ